MEPWRDDDYLSYLPLQERQQRQKQPEFGSVHSYNRYKITQKKEVAKQNILLRNKILSVKSTLSSVILSQQLRAFNKP